MLDRVMDSYEFPADLPDDAAPGTLRWTAGAIALATALLALTNAQAISGWADEFPPGPNTMKLIAAADAWQDATARAGLDLGHSRLHRVWKGLESARWSPPAPVVEEARR